jgi:hypothetical protein
MAKGLMGGPMGPITVSTGTGGGVSPRNIMQVWKTALTSVVPTTPLQERKMVETDYVEPVMAWPEERQALLFHLMSKAGWTKDRARSVLEKKKWWLW